MTLFHHLYLFVFVPNDVVQFSWIVLNFARQVYFAPKLYVAFCASVDCCHRSWNRYRKKISHWITLNKQVQVLCEICTLLTWYDEIGWIVDISSGLQNDYCATKVKKLAQTAQNRIPSIDAYFNGIYIHFSKLGKPWEISRHICMAKKAITREIGLTCNREMDDMTSDRSGWNLTLVNSWK